MAGFQNPVTVSVVFMCTAHYCRGEQWEWLPVAESASLLLGGWQPHNPHDQLPVSLWLRVLRQLLSSGHHTVDWSLLPYAVWGPPPPPGWGSWGASWNWEDRNSKRFGQSCSKAGNSGVCFCFLLILWEETVYSVHVRKCFFPTRELCASTFSIAVGGEW